MIDVATYKQEKGEHKSGAVYDQRSMESINVETTSNSFILGNKIHHPHTHKKVTYTLSYSN